MRKLTFALVMAAGLVTAQPADADLIVNTGPAFCDPNDFNCPFALADYQWLAGQFSVNNAWTITSVQGRIEPFVTGEVLFRLYSDNSGLPGVPLFTEPLTINGPTGAATWYGPSGLSWSILAGSYWLAFEVADGNPFYGGMPYASGAPLIKEAYNFYDPPNPRSYLRFDDLDIGVRVYADPVVSGTSVPDTTPTALLFLLGTGLIGAALRRGRRPAH